jgi:hypothetical protein
MFPKEKKKPKTDEGKRLQQIIFYSLIGHIFFFMLSLAFIGFVPML